MDLKSKPLTKTRINLGAKTKGGKRELKKGGFLKVWGPGLIVMLADTDAGCLITAAQSGAQWGYTMVLPQLLLIPILYMAQEMTVRLGIVTGKGHGELIRENFGFGWACLSAGTLALSVVGALLTEFVGVAGVGELFGISKWITIDLFRADRLKKFIFVDEPALGLDTKDNPSGLLNYQQTLDFCSSLYTDKEGALNGFIKNIVIDKSLNLNDLIEDTDKANADFVSPLFYNHMANDWSDIIKTIDIPSLVFSGKKSFFNWKLVKKVSEELQNSEFELFENVGHMLFFEEADRSIGT